MANGLVDRLQNELARRTFDAQAKRAGVKPDCVDDAYSKVAHYADRPAALERLRITNYDLFAETAELAEGDPRLRDAAWMTSHPGEMAAHSRAKLARLGEEQ